MATNENTIRALVRTAVESYAQGFQARHEAEVDNLWIVRAKRRKIKTIESWSNMFSNQLLASVAIAALKCGLGSKFIKKNFTYLRIEKHVN